MRLLKVDKKKGLMEILPEDKEDLWLLSFLIVPGDRVEGVVSRRIKREGERGSGRVFTFKVRLAVEEVEFSGSSLRIKGRIEEGPEDLVGKGKYQTLEVREGDKVRLLRERIEDSVIEEIRRAEEESRHPPVLVVSLDDESATFGRFSRRLTYLTTVRREGDEGSLREFFGEVFRKILDAPEEIVVVGGPKVIVDEFKDFVEERELGKRVHYVVTPLRGEKGLKDIVHKRASTLIHSERKARISRAIEDFLVHLAKADGLASLDPENDVEIGNLALLLVHEDWVRENREAARELMNKAREISAEVFVVTEDVENEAIVKKLGGKIGIRRYGL